MIVATANTLVSRLFVSPMFDGRNLANAVFCLAEESVQSVQLFVRRSHAESIVALKTFDWMDCRAKIATAPLYLSCTTVSYSGSHAAIPAESRREYCGIENLRLDGLSSENSDSSLISVLHNSILLRESRCHPGVLVANAMVCLTQESVQLFVRRSHAESIVALKTFDWMDCRAKIATAPLYLSCTTVSYSGSHAAIPAESRREYCGIENLRLDGLSSENSDSSLISVLHNSILLRESRCHPGVLVANAMVCLTQESVQLFVRRSHAESIVALKTFDWMDCRAKIATAPLYLSCTSRCHPGVLVANAMVCLTQESVQLFVRRSHAESIVALKTFDWMDCRAKIATAPLYLSCTTVSYSGSHAAIPAESRREYCGIENRRLDGLSSENSDSPLITAMHNGRVGLKQNHWPQRYGCKLQLQYGVIVNNYQASYRP
ncbi:hypothetical protein J6590_019915 [Homalodisca vitripennis]|nr:hypothetical protein J6590_019915 [Homalodisca vitripennis]